MSTPRCLRLAIEACRPSKSSVMRLRPALQSRHYASDQSHGDRDITKGFPTPQKSNHTPGQATNNSQNPSKLHSETQPKSSPVSSRPKNVSPTPRRNQSKDAAQPLSQQAAIPEASTANAGDALIEDQGSNSLPVPPNVLAAYRTPLRHKATHGIPVASLQLRSYSVRNLEFFADFALRAAFYLNLPASGPVPLPKITERWTMPRSNFVHKKSQENFERITRRRLITIMDGEKSAVEVWLAFLRKWQFYGVGMKANVWEFEGLDVAGKMDRQMAEVEQELDDKLANFGFNKTAAKDKSLAKMLNRQGMRHAGVPMTEVREASTTADQR